jgi:thioesterase domain-containing protein
MPTLVPLTRSDSGSRTPIFAIHNGAGSAYPYVPLARRLGADQPFYAMQQFEFGEPVAPFPSVKAMAQAYVSAVKALHPAGPYVFAGMCSGGGYVACEMAQQASALGEDIELLVLLDPMYGEVAQLCSQSRVLVSQAVEVTRRMIGLPGTDAYLPVLQAELAELLSAVGLDRQLLNLAPAYLNHFLEFFAANHRATLAYSPRLYTGRAVIFVPGLSRDDKGFLSETEWKELIPASEVHVLQVRRSELYSSPEIVAYIAAVLQAALR